MELEVADPDTGYASTPLGGHIEFEKRYLPFHGVENNTQAYLPLDPEIKQIRYIAIDPGTRDQPLSCFLGYASLLDSWRQPYQAVSYCWGDVSDTVEINLRCAKTKSTTVLSHESTATAQQYKVTRNLDALLRAFRLQYAPKFLWIDAICINQSDAAEKTHQVGSMSTIYSAATNVLVWLGEADIFSEILIKSEAAWKQGKAGTCRDIEDHPLEPLRTKFHTDIDLSGLFFDGYGGRPSKFVSSVVHVLAVVRRSLDRCFSRPWFRRIWVLQEVVLAPVATDGSPLVTVYMGSLQLQWDRLVDFAEVMAKAQPRREASDFGNLCFFNEVWSKFTVPPRGCQRPAFPIEDFLFMTTAFASSDPRDKLFAILQLATDTREVFLTNDLLRPDYSKSFSRVLRDYRRWHLDGLSVTLNSSDDRCKSAAIVATSRWHTNTTQHYFPNRHALDYLIAAQGPKNPNPGPKMPTWVTNIFARPVNTQRGREPHGALFAFNTSDHFLHGVGRYNASGSQVARQMPPDSPNSMSVQGQIIGRIWTALTPPLSEVKQLHTLASYLFTHNRSLWRLSRRESISPHRELRALRKVHRRAIKDFGMRQYEDTLKKVGTDTTAYDELPKFTALGLPYQTLFYPRKPGSQQYTFTMGSPPIQGTRVYLTNRGEFVLTSRNAVAGDIIAIVYGGRVPLLLRPEPSTVDGGSKKYKYVGACFFYQDKWMFGKEVHAGELLKEKDQFFELI